MPKNFLGEQITTVVLVGRNANGCKTPKRLQERLPLFIYLLDSERPKVLGGATCVMMLKMDKRRNDIASLQFQNIETRLVTLYK